MKKIALLLLISILPISSAHAKSYLTLGMAVGTAGQQYSDYYTDIVGISGVSARDSSIGIRLGIPFSRYFVMEGSIYDYGEANDKYLDDFGDLITVNLSTTTVNFGMTGIFPIYYSPADIVAKFGFAIWEADVEFRDSSAPGVVLTDSDDGVTFYMGFGARVSVAKNIRLGLEYTFLGFDTNYTGVVGDQVIDNFALTVDVQF